MNLNCKHSVLALCLFAIPVLPMRVQSFLPTRLHCTRAPSITNIVRRCAFTLFVPLPTTTIRARRISNFTVTSSAQVIYAFLYRFRVRTAISVDFLETRGEHEVERQNKRAMQLAACMRWADACRRATGDGLFAVFVPVRCRRRVRSALVVNVERSRSGGRVHVNYTISIRDWLERVGALRLLTASLERYCRGCRRASVDQGFRSHV